MVLICCGGVLLLTLHFRYGVFDAVRKFDDSFILILEFSHREEAEVVSRY